MAPWLGLIGLLALLGAGAWLRPVQPKATVRFQCGDLTQACAVTLDGKPVSLASRPAPAVLHPFRLVLRGSQGEVKVRFGMQGMDMGPIAYPFKPQTDGSLAADVMLPYCVQGRHDWWLQLESGSAISEVSFLSK
jgi:hypothetical protein